MADLKQGTTIGGNTIWTQGNLPLIPAGNFISYKGFKIYTSNDKPTAVDLGFLPAVGGIITGNLEVKGSTTLTNGTVSGILLFTRPDTAIQFSLANKNTLSLNYATDGNFGVWNTTQSKWSMYRGINEQWIFNDTGGVNVINTLNVSGDTTLAKTTITDLNTSAFTSSGRIIGANGMTLNSANAGIEMGSLSVVGTPYIDFHTSGSNNDYDLRLTANNNGLSVISPSTLLYFNLQTTQYLRMHNGMTSGIMMGRNSTVIKDHYNGNVSISASKRSDTEEIGGDLYLGYNSSGSSYTNTVQLESKMTWKGINELVNSNGKLVGASLDTAYLPITGGTVSSNLVVDGTISASGNVNAGSYSTPGTLTVQDTSTMAAINSSGNVKAASFNTTGTLTVSGNSVLNYTTGTDLISLTGYLRTRSAGNCHLWFENNVGTERALIWSGPDNALNMRCAGNYIHMQGANLNVTKRVSANDLLAVGNVYAGNGASYLNSDGNINGPVWQSGWLSTHIENRAYAHAVERLNTYLYSQDSVTVGSFVMAFYTGGNVGLGQLVAGSGLRPATCDGAYDNNYALPGTWMCSGRSLTTNEVHRTTIWKRVG